MIDMGPEFNKKLKQQKICPMDLKEALILARDFRAEGIQRRVGYKAMRVAILFTELVDSHVAAEKLHPINEVALRSLARALYHKTIDDTHKKGGA